jgi:hypothetical protein
MSFLRLEKVLATLPGARAEGNAFLLSEEQDVTLYISLGDEVLQIARASRVELTTEMTTVITHKGERFFVPPERVVALKSGAQTKAVAAGAGFRA